MWTDLFDRDVNIEKRFIRPIFLITKLVKWCIRSNRRLLFVNVYH